MSSAEEGGELPAAALPPVEWRTNLVLFLATVASVFATYLFSTHETDGPYLYGDAFAFTGALLGILVAHEFGHFIAARIHKVDASLPFFIPLPMLSPFGTMGAVIRMRGVIPTRRALLDIGASGPLAGLCVAIPLYIWGIAHSEVKELVVGKEYGQLGESLLIRLVDHFAAPAVPEGSEVFLSPVGWAAWGGMLVTMINLLPVGQLDAGHVAYALFGPRQNKIAVIAHRAVLVFFFVSLASYCFVDLRAGFGLSRIGKHVGNSVFWLVWFEVLAVLGSLTKAGGRGESDADSSSENRTLSPRTRAMAAIGLALLAWVMRLANVAPALYIPWLGSVGVLIAMEAKWGVLKAHTLLDHPPTGAAPLGFFRSAVAVVTLLFFVALFMPAPFSF